MQRCFKYAGHHGERVTNNGHPAGEKRPQAVFLIERAIAIKILGADWKEAAVAPARDEEAKRPIHA